MRNIRHIPILFLLIGLLYGFNSCTDKNPQSKLSPVSHDSILSPKLLNSERIKLKFGSYNIQVLTKNSKLRVSDLYSLHGDQKITRTFAVVSYPGIIDSMFLKEHTKILEGHSIGRVFKQGQWKIEKKSLFLGEIMPSPDYMGIYKRMGNIDPSKLAIYAYGFTIKKDNRNYQYATISEVYHPDYLTLNDLKKMIEDSDAYLDKTAFSPIVKQVEREMKTKYNK
ncbi:hypothetical protein [Ulvibacterium sp.]|uniref:hypothetical protein n=1 Tax=Ulvibacterium sp. TaxID=2665914 RepID=UPI00262ABE24|nr:hypothetical protein [Ulvibacterium sp.]